MSLTLDATLQTAQDSANHKIIVEIKNSLNSGIPFLGNLLTSETDNEDQPTIITHSSSGRICAAYIFDDNIKYVYTDESREEFFTVTLNDQTDLGLGFDVVINDVSIVELSDTTIGLIFTCYTATNYYLRTSIISVVGIVSSNALIATYIKTSYTEVTSPCCLYIAAGSYLLVYIVDTSSTASTAYSRTSADFASWSAEAAISIAGISTEAKHNIHINQIDTDDIFLCLDYENTTNIINSYYSISTDNGSSWGAAVAITAYTNTATIGKHPVSIQQATDQLHIIWDEKSNALAIDADTTDWPGDVASVTSLHIYDEHIYMICTYTNIGDKYLIGVVKVKIDTWEIVDSWTTTSTPAFNTNFGTEHCWWQCNQHEDKYIVVGCNIGFCAVLDVDVDTITHYYLKNDVSKSLVKNIDWSPSLDTEYLQIEFCSINNGILYLVTTAANYDIEIISIDLDQGSPALYATTTVYYSSTLLTEVDRLYLHTGFFKIFSEASIAVLASTVISWASFWGSVFIFDTTDSENWVTYKTFLGWDDDLDTSTMLPRRGILDAIYYDGALYCTFNYETNYSQSARKGIVKIVIDSEVSYFLEPSWGSYADYGFLRLYKNDNNDLFVSSSLYGISKYNIDIGDWTLFDNNTVPGLVPDNSDTDFMPIIYDETLELIFSGKIDNAGWEGLIGFSGSGALSSPQYRIATYSAGWTMNAASDFISGQFDSNTQGCLDPITSNFWIFWTHQTGSELSIYWDKEITDFDFSPLLVTDKNIISERSIDKPARLTFNIARGQLFDETNINSIYHNYLKKGTIITYRLGENVLGTEYWQNQGTFRVKNKDVSFSKGIIPIMKVICEDERSVLDDMELITTPADYDENYPEDIIANILENLGSISNSNIQIDTIDNRAILYHQWINSKLLDIVNEICDRFGYFLRIDVDNVFKIRKISDSNSIDHIYSSTDKLITYSPDNNFSDYVNRIIAQSEERDFREITYAEQELQTRNGTIGWWQGTESIRIPYSDDNSMKCTAVNAKFDTELNAIFKWEDSVNWKITNHDTYCTLQIQAPLLLEKLIFALTATLIVDVIPYIGGFLSAAGFLEIFRILATVTNWSIRIFGRIQGSVRAAIQSQADDLDFQNEIGKIVARTIEEPLAYTIAQLQEVAEHELLITKLQRNKISIEKIGHLQDEEGDTIQIVHPYSNNNLKIFITSITRIVNIPSKSNAASGMFDQIEGWKL